MSLVAERQAERTAFLLALYEMLDGDPGQTTNYREVARRLELSEGDAHRTAQWLVDRRLAAWRAMGGSIHITPAGVDEAERLLSKGAAVPVSLLVLTPDEHRAVEAFLTQYRQAQEAGGITLAGDDELDAEAQVLTVEAQLRSPRPRRRVVRVALRELYGLAHGAGGNAVWEGLKLLVGQIG